MISDHRPCGNCSLLYARIAELEAENKMLLSGSAEAAVVRQARIAELEATVASQMVDLCFEHDRHIAEYRELEAQLNEMQLCHAGEAHKVNELEAALAGANNFANELKATNEALRQKVAALQGAAVMLLEKHQHPADVTDEMFDSARLIVRSAAREASSNG